jgi:hypothetical protein
MWKHLAGLVCCYFKPLNKNRVFLHYRYPRTSLL